MSDSLKQQIADKLREDFVSHWKGCDQCRDKVRMEDLCHDGSALFQVAALANDPESVLTEKWNNVG